MVYPVLVRRKLSKLAEYLKELESLSLIEPDQFDKHFYYKRSAERLLQLVVEVAVDINNHIIVDEGKPPSKDYYSSFVNLTQLGVYSIDFATNIAPSAGFRNIIVHEYEEIDDDIVLLSMHKALPQFKEYMKHIMVFLDNKK